MPNVLWLVPGVLLPLVTLAVEITMRLSAEVLFDPLPTWFNAALVALVPAANLAAWWAARRTEAPYRRAIALANGAAIGISLFYALLYLPITPLAFPAIAYNGMGLLPLAPLFAFICAVRLRFALARGVAEGQRLPGAWRGAALGIAALVALEVPTAITRVGTRMAYEGDAATQARGITLIRYAGSEEQLLRLCYPRSGLGMDMLGFLFETAGRPVHPEEVRKVYYRVTGRPFNAVSAPKPKRATWGWFGNGRFDWDEGQGGTSVDGRVDGLSLAASRLDGSADAEAALGYLEWTMVFRNASAVQREARAQIAVPHGAVVSRVTLWIDGEEREAAFAGRAQVREAYQKVVRQQRDPVLVTTAGPGRVLMQLFPVPPGGEMKVRIGVTLPLALHSVTEAALRMPYFHERNFDIPDALRHALWVEWKQGAVRRELRDADLPTSASRVMLARTGAPLAWSADPRGGEHVRQRIVERREPSPRRLIVVVDGSVGMREAAARVARVLERLPERMELAVMFASDDAQPAPRAERVAEIVHRLRDHSYRGGHDNVPALARALEAVDGKSALLWITGAQPVVLGTLEPLLQPLERRVPPPWYVLQVVPGSNVILEKLPAKAAPLVLDDHDLERLIAAWRPGGARLVAERGRAKSTSDAAHKTSDHLVRLLVHDEILALVAAGGEAQRQSAVALAQKYQLVTAVSGAVVLETRRQYDEAGLEPAAPGSVPTVPEPEEWALILAALLALLYGLRRYRGTAVPARLAV